MWGCPKCRRAYTLKDKHFRNGFYCQCGYVAHGKDGMNYVEAVGDEVADILKTLGFSRAKGCGCKILMREMNSLGAAGCRREFRQLVAKLTEKYEATTWTERIRAAGLAVLSGIAFKLNIADPIPDLLNEAIRRADSNCRA